MTPDQHDWQLIMEEQVLGDYLDMSRDQNPTYTWRCGKCEFQTTLSQDSKPPKSSHLVFGIYSCFEYQVVRVHSS